MARNDRTPRRIFSDRRASILRTLVWVFLWITVICGALLDIRITLQKYRIDISETGLPLSSDAPQEVYVEWPSIAERV